MPRNMTMQWPSSRVICLDLKHDMLTSRKLLYVSSLRIGGVDNSTIPVPRALMEDHEIVAMHVHWMRREANWIVNHEGDGIVGVVVVDVPFRRVGKVSHIC